MVRASRFVTCLGLLVLLVLRPGWGQEAFSAQVVGVTDGDTLRVLRDGRATVIRLYGVDAPESGQAFGTAAKQFVSKKCFGQSVSVTPRGKDAYGRSIGTVTTDDGQDLSESLLRNGYGWWYHQFAPMAKTLAAEEAAARGARAGLWQDANPTPPWAFRHPTPDPQVQSLRAALAQKSAEIDSLRSQLRQARTPTPSSPPPSSALVPPPTYSPPRFAPAPAPAPDPMDRTVYVTRTGTKYHAAGCRYLSRSMFPMKLREAMQRYSACSVCGGG